MSSIPGMPRDYRIPPEARFFKLVEKTTYCWHWRGSLTHDGYGQFRLEPGKPGKTVRAHRWSFEHLRFVIPEGFQIDHLCGNPACVRPDHLEAVTGTENIRRSGHGYELRCAEGHEFTPENTRIVELHSGPRAGTTWRECRQCHVRRVKQYKQRLKELV